VKEDSGGGGGGSSDNDDGHDDYILRIFIVVLRISSPQNILNTTYFFEVTLVEFSCMD
jgi:hypothetical protein